MFNPQFSKAFLRSISVVAVGGVFAISGNCAKAQITPDSTLGSESSLVTPQTPGSTVNVISGGATRGENLFHSFEQFSILTGHEALFNNASGIQNIINRVTGGSTSSIDGLLRANGTANLFLINPNGIIFGPSARLNIGGSFVASTASSLNFADGTQFSATAPQTTPLLTVKVPIGLRLEGTTGSILVQGNGEGTRITTNLIDTTAGLRVQPNQTLALVGGDVALEGGTLKTVGGRIELGSVAGDSLVNLNATEKGFSLGYEAGTAFRDIRLSHQAAVDASGIGGGDVQVQGRQISLTDGSQIEASTLGGETGGTLNINASDSVELIGRSPNESAPSGLFASVELGATGAGGDITLKTQRLSVRDGAQISSGTSDIGNAGKLLIEAEELVELIGTSVSGRRSSGLFAQSRLGSSGTGGDITLKTQQLSVRDGAQISSGTFGKGSGGNLSIEAGRLAELIGTSASGQIASGLFTSVEPGATGTGGNLILETQQLIVRDGAVVSSATFGGGAAGSLMIKAQDSVDLIGRSLTTQRGSALAAIAGPRATGAGGDITLETQRLIVRDGAQISSATLGEGTGGNLSIRAGESVQLIGTSPSGNPSALSARTIGSKKGGNLNIKTGQLSVRDGARVTVSSTSTANDAQGAGNTNVTAQTIRLDNKGQITAETQSGNGGDINLQTQDFLLIRNNSKISATAGIAGNGGDGGNITINSQFIFAPLLENSDITANAFEARGGNVNITATTIFGLVPRSREELQTLLRTNNPNELDPSRLASNDITAISQTNPSLSGDLTIITPNIDPNNGLVDLPTVITDLSNSIGQECANTVGPGASKFIITGTGGLPEDPTKPLNGQTIWTDSRLFLTPEEKPTSPPSPATQPTDSTAVPLTEASIVDINSKGEAVLTATAPSSSLQIPWLNPPSCHAS